MMKLLQIFFTGGSCVAFFVTMYWSVRGFAAFLSQFGAYKVRRSPINFATIRSPLNLAIGSPLESCLALNGTVLSGHVCVQVVVTALLVIWCGISLARSFVLVRYPLAERPAPTS